MTGMIVVVLLGLVAFIIGYACGWYTLREKIIKDMQKLTSDFLKVDDVANRLVNVLGRIDPYAVAKADAEQRIADIRAKAEDDDDNDDDARLMSLGDDVLKQYLYEDHDEGRHAETEDGDDE